VSVHILKLHHAAYRCRNSEETRAFYEDFLGLALVDAITVEETATGRPTRLLHTFYRMDDGSHLAFFEVPGAPFVFKDQHDFDLHIALEVAGDTLDAMHDKGLRLGIETRGVSDHGFVRSVYFRDPNGYVLELCARQTSNDSTTRTAREARDALDRWTQEMPN
jgi:catechol 2,3-dioxygenase-like lactoylglutathione lyase family enzyme